MGEITEIIREVHGNAVMKGFYEDVESLLLHNNLTNDQKKFIKDAVISQLLMLITSELGEALEANRKDKVASLLSFDLDLSNFIDQSPDIFKMNFERHIKDSFEDELADAVIRIFDLAGFLNIDLERHIQLKHKYNLGRPFMHNKKF